LHRLGLSDLVPALDEFRDRTARQSAIASPLRGL
jgi:hypothetical protein